MCTRITSFYFTCSYFQPSSLLVFLSNILKTLSNLNTCITIIQTHNISIQTCLLLQMAGGIQNGSTKRKIKKLKEIIKTHHSHWGNIKFLRKTVIPQSLTLNETHISFLQVSHTPWNTVFKVLHSTKKFTNKISSIIIINKN